MRSSTERFGLTDGAEAVALDWESLGRLVRVGTLDAVAMHFAHVGREAVAVKGSPRGLKPAARDSATHE